MKAITPSRSYQFAALPCVLGHRIESITYTVPSITRTGEVHTIQQDPADGRLWCDCPARVQCWASKACAAGLVKPRIRIEPKAAAKAFDNSKSFTDADLYGDAGAALSRSLRAVAS